MGNSILIVALTCALATSWWVTTNLEKSTGVFAKEFTIAGVLSYAFPLLSWKWDISTAVWISKFVTGLSFVLLISIAGSWIRKVEERLAPQVQDIRGSVTISSTRK